MLHKFSTFQFVAPPFTCFLKQKLKNYLWFLSFPQFLDQVHELKTIYSTSIPGLKFLIFKKIFTTTPQSKRLSLLPQTNAVVTQLIFLFPLFYPLGVFCNRARLSFKNAYQIMSTSYLRPSNGFPSHLELSWNSWLIKPLMISPWLLLQLPCISVLRCVGKCLRTGSPKGGGGWELEEPLTYSVCQFLWCNYPYCDQLQSTKSYQLAHKIPENVTIVSH